MIHGGNYLINFIIAFDVSSQASGAGDHTHSYEVTAGNLPHGNVILNFYWRNTFLLLQTKLGCFLRRCSADIDNIRFFDKYLNGRIPSSYQTQC